MPVNPYRATTRVMTAFPPLRFQKFCAALSSEDRSMTSSDLRSAGESVVWPFDSCSSRSSAMNSFTTDAIGKGWLSPLETIWPVLRSSTTAEMSAPDFAASAVACRVRASRPSNVGRRLVGRGFGQRSQIALRRDDRHLRRIGVAGGVP